MGFLTTVLCSSIPPLLVTSVK